MLQTNCLIQCWVQINWFYSLPWKMNWMESCIKVMQKVLLNRTSYLRKFFKVLRWKWFNGLFMLLPARYMKSCSFHSDVFGIRWGWEYGNWHEIACSPSLKAERWGQNWDASHRKNKFSVGWCKFWGDRINDV